MRSAVAPARCNGELHPSDRAQHRIMIDNAIAYDVNDLALLLQPPPHRDHRGRHDLAAIDLEPIRPEDPLCDAGLILDGDEEDAFGGGFNGWWQHKLGSALQAFGTRAFSWVVR